MVFAFLTTTTPQISYRKRNYRIVMKNRQWMLSHWLARNTYMNPEIFVLYRWWIVFVQLKRQNIIFRSNIELSGFKQFFIEGVDHCCICTVWIIVKHKWMSTVSMVPCMNTLLSRTPCLWQINETRYLNLVSSFSIAYVNSFLILFICPCTEKSGWG